MFFKLNENKEVELKYSFRSSIYFEQITGHNIDLSKLTQNDVVTLFYCVVIASLQKAKEPVIPMLDFLDAIDDFNGGEKCILEFGNWYVDVLKAQFEVLDSTEDNKKKKETAKKKKD